MFIRSRVFHMLVGMITLGFATLFCGCATNAQAETNSSEHKGMIYRNPRVYNVEHSIELFPDTDKIDRDKDLKLWVPIPREWDSQKAVKIISVEPAPHGRYVDPEYGNSMLFWDFGKEPEKPSYKVSIRCRLEQYETYADIDPDQVGSYDRKSKDYILYTRSTHAITIADKVKQFAEIAVGNEENPYLQAKRIYEFIRSRMYYIGSMRERGLSLKSMLESSVIDQKTGQEYYIGNCYCYSTFFVALCRIVGVPARRVMAFWDRYPWNRMDPEGLESATESRNSLANGAVKFFAGHVWTEIYLPNYGWVTVDPAFEGFGHSNNSNKAVIICKGRNILIGPDAPQEGSEGYGIGAKYPLREGRIDGLGVSGVKHISHMQRVATERLHHPDPFPADALVEYGAKLYPETQGGKNLALYRKCALRWLDQNTRERSDKIAALAQAYERVPRIRYEHELFICYMLHKVVGDKKFSEIVKTYTDLRVKSGEPVSTDRFQNIAEEVYGRPLDWFFSQWVEYRELPQLQLDAVAFSEDGEGWHVCGTLRQLNKSVFCLPVGLVLETEKANEHKMLWVEDKVTDFEFRTANRPTGVLMDPDNDILQIRKMPPLLDGSSHDEIAFCTITDQEKADLFGWTPLHFAADAGQTEVVEYLIAAGADVEAKTIEGETPVQFAADKGHKEIAKLLIEKGADVSLHLVARLGDQVGVKRLIEQEGDVNSIDIGGKSPLYVAVRNNQKEVAELLIAKGADVNMEDYGGETSLHAAAAKGHEDVAELLMAKGAEVDAKKPGYTPLTWAIWNDDRDMIKLLATHGADVNFKPKNDDPAIYYSVWNEDVELAKLLLAHGARLDVKDDNGWTVFRHSASQGNKELVEFFVSKGATAPEFHLAACMGNLNRVKRFVEKGTNVDTKDEVGWTPLYWAASMGREEVAEFLISNEADIDVEIGNNRTLLHQAATAGAAKLAKLLISKGADVNVRAKNNSTPLHSAAAGGHKHIVELLIANCADVNAKGRRGQTALTLAKDKGHTEIVALLRKHGANK